MARTMRDEALLLSGQKIASPPQWMIGAVENPFAAPLAFRAERLGKKVAAGAQFCQTQLIFDVEIFERWMARVRELGLDRRCHIIAGVGPLRSLRALEFMRREVPGMHVPESIVARLRAAADTEAESILICAEIIRRVRAIPGVSGIHVMTVGWEEAIPEILDRAGIGARSAGARTRLAPC